MTEPRSTRQRLLDEGMRLFAERGFRATGVGDIEAAAGLQPRRGALYKHFPSKQALLEAAVRSHLAQAATDAYELGDIDLADAGWPDPAQRQLVVTAIGRWFLDEMDRLEDLTRVVEQDGALLPGLVVELRAGMVDLSYRTAARIVATTAPDLEDSEATAVVVLGALVALRRTAWTFGAPPLGIDDNRALAAWADVVLTTLAPRPGPAN
jgi:AcrR family transcriptional regulator